ncbi:MAG: TadE/TadG family type IV pilus assembly protein [Pacificimonas sp.]
MIGKSIPHIFRRDERGSTIVEFAILAPILMMMIGGSVELGHLAMMRSTLEGATAAAARQAMTGACPSSRKADMAAYIVDRMDTYSSPDAAPTIIVKNFGGSVGDVGPPEPYDDDDGNGQYDVGEPYEDLNGNGSWNSGDHLANDLGGPGDVVQYEARFRGNTLFPFLKWTTGADTITVSASTIVRNEPIFSGKCANVTPAPTS